MTPPVEKYFEISALWRNTFLPKIGDFFEIFEIYLHTTPQKSLFIAFLLTNFPKISKKVLKNFSRRLRRRKCGEIPQFFRPVCGKIPPPPLRGPPPPPKISLVWTRDARNTFRGGNTFREFPQRGVGCMILTLGGDKD